MDDVLALQYRRGRKVLQIIVMPYSLNTSTSAVLRIFHLGNPPEPEKGWRVLGTIGMPFSLKLDDLDAFEADAMLAELMRSPWMASDKRVTMSKQLVSFTTWDAGDIRMERTPHALIARVQEEVENWA
jgi:hypothetical protein